MAKLLLLFVICVGLLPVAVQAQENTEFIPGEVWKDTDGNPINAHGGGRTHHGVLKYTAEEARALMLGQVREVEAV